MGENETLGKRLRRLSENAKVTAEVERFTKILEEAAIQGNDRVHVNDLREYIPTLILNGTAAKWFADNELIWTGSVDPESGAYNYIISW
jgi:hypothetical protein